MPSLNISPTPPTPLESPLRTIYAENIGLGETARINGGFFRGIPQLWRIHRVVVMLVNSAVVANRSIRFQLYDDPNTDMALYFSGQSIAASTTGRAYIIPVNYMNTFTSNGDVLGYTQPPMFGGIGYFLAYIANMQAGDLFKIQVVLEYMNRQLGLPAPEQDSKGG